MSGPAAISLVSQALQQLLEGRMRIPDVAVSLLAPDESGPAKRVNLFLYKVEEHPQLKNADWQPQRGSPGRLAPPPLSLRLFYLLTAYATVTDQQEGNRTAQAILGDAMRVLYEHPLIPAEYLADDLQAAREQIKVMLAPLDMDDLSRIWGTFDRPFRPSVLYEVSVVQIDAAPGQERPVAERVRRIGSPCIEAPFVPPTLAAIEPLEVRPGEALTVLGEHLAGWSAEARLGGKPIATPGRLAADQFTLSVPPDCAPGLYELQVDIAALCRRTFFFVVTAP